MTSTPLATIADALIEFILSLLRDPAAAAAFEEEPEEVLARAGLGNVCVDDVRAVVPVVVEHPAVTPRPTPPVEKPVPVHPRPEVIKEISTVANTFHIDNRSTIVDQSVNQNIWAHGDVTQIFDQEAVLAVGDQSMAAGDDAVVDTSDTDITTGDIAVGNTDTDVSIADSFNDSSVDADTSTDVDADSSFNDSSVDSQVDTDISGSFNEEHDTQVDVDVDVDDSSGSVSVLAPAEPVADPLSATLVADDPVEEYVSDYIEDVPLDLETEES